MNLDTWISKEGLPHKEVADLLGTTMHSLAAWLRNRVDISIDNVWKIYEVTNGEVLPHEMRPDVFKQDELKKIYGCPLCRNKSPNDYEQWFQSLAEAVKRDHKIIRRNKNKKKEQDV